MKIAIDAREIIGKRAGIGTYVYEIIRELESRPQVKHIYLLSHKPFAKDEFSSKVENVCISLPNRYYVLRVTWEQILLKFVLDKLNPDVFIGMNFICPINWKGKKIVVVHDVAYEIFPETKTVSALGYFRKWVPKSVNAAERIVTVSNHSKQDIVRYYHVDENKISICPPSIDYSCYEENIYNEPLKPEVAKKYNLSKEYFLYVGTIEPRKNILCLLKAYHQLIQEGIVNYSLVLCGKTGWLADDVFEYIKSNQLEGYIIITGYVSNEEKINLLKHARLFVFPSSYEGFGMPLLEAMASKVPTIASNTSSIPEVVGKAAYLFDPNNPQELKHHIKEVLNNKDKAKELVDLGAIQIKEFTWEKSVDELLKVLQGLVN